MPLFSCVTPGEGASSPALFSQWEPWSDPSLRGDAGEVLSTVPGTEKGLNNVRIPSLPKVSPMNPEAKLWVHGGVDFCPQRCCCQPGLRVYDARYIKRDCRQQKRPLRCTFHLPVAGHWCYSALGMIGKDSRTCRSNRRLLLTC